ncbi:MAG: hypothetical protein JW904_09310 [Spirochaetales bacterium]|nr:hypothetical protein [Spirochaetales bacterium]
MEQQNSNSCECLKKCSFFNDKMADMQLVSDLMKMKYCKGEHWECGRFMVFKVLGKEHVPDDLYPNEVYRAAVLLKKA